MLPGVFQPRRFFDDEANGKNQSEAPRSDGVVAQKNRTVAVQRASLRAEV